MKEENKKISDVGTKLLKDNNKTLNYNKKLVKEINELKKATEIKDSESLEKMNISRKINCINYTIQNRLTFKIKTIMLLYFF